MPCVRMFAVTRMFNVNHVTLQSTSDLANEFSLLECCASCGSPGELNRRGFVHGSKCIIPLPSSCCLDDRQAFQICFDCGECFHS